MSTLSANARTAATDAVADLCDAGASAGELRIYTAGFATLLAIATLPDPAFAPAASGVASLSSAIAGVAVIASGTAAVYRLMDSDGVVILDGSVGLSGADLNFDSIAWSSGDVIDIPTFTITTPGA